jgi:hypothetical protein
MEQGKSFSSGQNNVGDTWYVDNYVLLKEYYDMTISRIAARCIRSGNIAIEEYKHYAYILDVLEEISETGDYIVAHPDLYSYVDRKIAGGINELKRNLREFKSELEHNASPEMVHQDKNELNKLKEALGAMDKAADPTVGAGMSMDDVVNKLMQENHIQTPSSQQPQAQPAQPRPQPAQPRPQPAQPQAQPAQPRPQPAQSQAQPAQPRPQYTEKPQG